MNLNWYDIEEIAYALEEKYPDVDNLNLRFTDLKKWIEELDNFVAGDTSCNEKKLEAIQQAWILHRAESAS